MPTRSGKPSSSVGIHGGARGSVGRGGSGSISGGSGNRSATHASAAAGASAGPAVQRQPRLSDSSSSSLVAEPRPARGSITGVPAPSSTSTKGSSRSGLSGATPAPRPSLTTTGRPAAPSPTPTPAPTGGAATTSAHARPGQSQVVAQPRPSVQATGLAQQPIQKLPAQAPTDTSVRPSQQPEEFRQYEPKSPNPIPAQVMPTASQSHSNQSSRPTDDADDEEYSDDYENYEDDFEDEGDSTPMSQPGITSQNSETQSNVMVRGTQSSSTISQQPTSMSAEASTWAGSDDMDEFAKGSTTDFGSLMPNAGLPESKASFFAPETHASFNMQQSSDSTVPATPANSTGDQVLMFQSSNTFARKRERLRAFESLTTDQRAHLSNRLKNLMGQGSQRVRDKVNLRAEGSPDLLVIPSSIGLRRSLTAQERTAKSGVIAMVGSGAGSEWLARREKSGAVRSIGTSMQPMEIDDLIDLESDDSDAYRQTMDAMTSTNAMSEQSAGTQLRDFPATTESLNVCELYKSEGTQTPAPEGRAHVSTQVDSLKIAEFWVKYERLQATSEFASSDSQVFDLHSEDESETGRPSVERWTVGPKGLAEEFDGSKLRRAIAQGDPRLPTFRPISQDSVLRHLVTRAKSEETPEREGEPSTITEATAKDSVAEFRSIESGVAKFLKKVAPSVEVLLIENSEAQSENKESSLQEAHQVGAFNLDDMNIVVSPTQSNPEQNSILKGCQLELPNGILPSCVTATVSGIEITQLPRGILPSPLVSSPSQAEIRQQARLERSPLEMTYCAVVAFDLHPSANPSVSIGTLGSAFVAETQGMDSQWQALCRRSNSLLAVFDLSRQDAQQCVALMMSPGHITSFQPPRPNPATAVGMAGGTYPAFLFIAGSDEGGLTLWSLTDTPFCTSPESCTPVYVPIHSTTAAASELDAIANIVRSERSHHDAKTAQNAGLFGRVIRIQLIPVRAMAYSSPVSTPTAKSGRLFASPATLTLDSVRGLKLLAIDDLGNTVLYAFSLAMSKSANQSRKVRVTSHVKQLQCLELRKVAYFNLVSGSSSRESKRQEHQKESNVQGIDSLAEAISGVCAISTSIGFHADDDVLVASLASQQGHKSGITCRLKGLQITSLPALGTGELTHLAVSELSKTYAFPESLAQALLPCNEMPPVVHASHMKATAIATLPHSPNAPVPRRRGQRVLGVSNHAEADNATVIDPLKTLNPSILFLVGYADGSLALYSAAVPAAPLQVWNAICDTAIEQIVPLPYSRVRCNSEIVGDFIVVDRQRNLHYWSLSMAAELVAKANRALQRSPQHAVKFAAQASFASSGPLFTLPLSSILGASAVSLNSRLSIRSVPGGFIVASDGKAYVEYALVETEQKCLNVLETEPVLNAGILPEDIGTRFTDAVIAAVFGNAS